MKLKSLDDFVWKCMSDGRWWTFWELQDTIKNKTVIHYGEPTISAAIRNLRKPYARSKYNLCQYGETVMKKRITGGKGYQYKLIGENNVR